MRRPHQNGGIPKIGDTPYFTNLSEKSKLPEPFSKKIFKLHFETENAGILA